MKLKVRGEKYDAQRESIKIQQRLEKSQDLRRKEEERKVKRNL